jgi:hypothetical protein
MMIDRYRRALASAEEKFDTLSRYCKDGEDCECVHHMNALEAIEKAERELKQVERDYYFELLRTKAKGDGGKLASSAN